MVWYMVLDRGESEHEEAHGETKVREQDGQRALDERDDVDDHADRCVEMVRDSRAWKGGSRQGK